jgi:hypothetical protein
MEYLAKRGLPAMNHFCKTVGCSEAEIVRLTERVTEYIINDGDRSEA